MRDSERESFRRCGETCPDVEDAFTEALTKIRKLVPEKLHDELASLIEDCMGNVKKYGTYALREALTDACEELSTMEDNIEDLEKEVGYLKSKLGETA